MDLVTFIKKEEPVDYVLTTDDCEKFMAQTAAKEIIVTVRYFGYQCSLM